MAEENRSWGYDRIVGALANLGHEVSDQTWRRITDWETFSDTEAMRQKAQQIGLLDRAFPDPTPPIVNPLLPLNPQKAQAVIAVPPQRPGGSTDPPLDCAIMRPISEDQLDPARAAGPDACSSRGSSCRRGCRGVRVFRC
jgi:hypothetical protein